MLAKRLRIVCFAAFFTVFSCSGWGAVTRNDLVRVFKMVLNAQKKPASPRRQQALKTLRAALSEVLRKSQNPERQELSLEEILEAARQVKTMKLRPKTRETLLRALVFSKKRTEAWMASKDCDPPIQPEIQPELVRSVEQVSNQFLPQTTKANADPELENPVPVEPQTTNPKPPQSTGQRSAFLNAFVNNKIQTRPNIEAQNEVQSNQPAGFKNLGNTCYANSAFKALLSIPNITDLIQQSINQSPPGELKFQSFKQEILRLFTLAKGKNPEGIETQLDRVFKAYQRIPGRERFNPNIQQDSAEFLADLTQILGGTRVFGGIQVQRKIQYENNQVEWEASKTSPTLRVDPGQSKVSDIWAKSMATQTQNFWSAGKIHPNTKVSHAYVYDPGQVPDNLMIKIERSDHHRVQHHRRIQIDPVLNFPVLKKETQNLEKPEFDSVPYRPQTVIVHHGDLQSGHYYAYIYDDQRKTWFKHNDAVVTELQGPSLSAALEDMETHATFALYRRQSK